MATQYIAELEDAELLFVHTIGDLRDKEMLVALGIKYGSKAIVQRAYELSKESAMKRLVPIDDVDLLKKDKCKKEIHRQGSQNCGWFYFNYGL